MWVWRQPSPLRPTGRPPLPAHLTPCAPSPPVPLLPPPPGLLLLQAPGSKAGEGEDPNLDENKFDEFMGNDAGVFAATGGRGQQR